MASTDTSGERYEPGFRLAEREMLEGWLDYHRATLRWKVDGLAGPL